MAKSDKPKTGFFKESTGEPIDDGAEAVSQPASRQIDIATTAHDLATETLAGVAVEADTTAKELGATQEIEINTMNEFGLGLQMNSIRPIAFPQFTSKQQAYRFAAWLINMAEMLPDEPLDHTFDEVNEAIRNT